MVQAGSGLKEYSQTTVGADNRDVILFLKDQAPGALFLGKTPGFKRSIGQTGLGQNNFARLIASCSQRMGDPI